MSTVDRAFADRIVAGGGWIDGDSNNELGDNPRVTLIVKYQNFWGNEAFGLVFEGQRNKYAQSPYVRGPVEYWRAP